MTTKHEDNARVLYGGNRPAAKPVPAAPVRRSIYDKASSEAGSHDLSLSSYYTKRLAELRDDPERLGQARTERNRLLALAQQRGVKPAALHEALVALGEFETPPRSIPTGTAEDRARAAKDKLEQRFRNTWETLRREEGSEEAAAKIWERAQRGGEVLDREVPSIATRANSTGVVADVRAMRFLASLADEPSQPPAAANLEK